MYKPIAPDTFWKIPKEERDRKYEGCGPGKYGDWIVPDDIWGLNITEECQIHDHWYEIGETEAHKIQADYELLENLYRKIEAFTSPEAHKLKALRILRAETYYEMVSLCGHTAFWKGKEKDEDKLACPT